MNALAQYKNISTGRYLLSLLVIFAGLMVFAPEGVAAAPSGCYTKTAQGYHQGSNADCQGKTDATGRRIATPPNGCYYVISGDPSRTYASIPCASFTPQSSSGTTTTVPQSTVNMAQTTGKLYNCGGGSGYSAIKTRIDFGCKGQGNPIADLSFAIIRFLSNGVGVVMVISIIWAGLQYISSRGDPNNTANAVDRIRNTFVALLIYIFAYAIINYVVPNGILR